MSVASLDTPLLKSRPSSLEHPPELQLLLSCARRELTAEDAVPVSEILGRPIDWERLVSLAQTHGLLPLLQWHLDRHFASELPAQIRSALQQQFQSNTRRNLLLVREIIHVVELLGNEGMQVMHVRGEERSSPWDMRAVLPAHFARLAMRG